MKVLGGGHYLVPEAGVDPGRLIRFALAQPVTVAIVGCSTPEHVRTLASMARAGEKPADESHEELIRFFRPHARRLAFYRGRI